MEKPWRSMPDHIRQALQQNDLTSAYEVRPAYQRNDYINWINCAVREETRQKRLSQMLDELRSQKTYMGMPYNASKLPKNVDKNRPAKILNTKIYSFQAVIQAVEGIDGAYIVFPYDAEKEFDRKRVAITATFEGIPYEGSLMRMGTVEHIIGIRKDIRAKINKQPGDKISVTVQERSF